MSDTRIGQVRIRTNTEDPLAARMRGDAALRALDLEPPGMPSRVILCIREMADPLPGVLDLRSAHAPRATEWERAARNSINDALHRAVRVADGDVPTTADAVLFSDRAELLACSARDVLHDGDGWWWRDTIRGGLSWTHVIREWMRAPQYVPATLDLLVRSGDAIAFVRRLDPQQAIELMTNVLRVYALEPLARKLLDGVNAAVQTPRSMPVALPPVLQALVPEVIATSLIATLEQRVFAVITLAVRRAPSIVRSELFAKQVSEWIGVPDSPALQAVAPTRIANVVPNREATPAATPIGQRVPEATPTEKEQRRADFSSPPQSAPASIAGDEPDELKPVPRSTTQPRREGTTTAAPSASIATPAETIHTEYAGLFFLLNLATALGYYDPYGRETSLDLDIWDFLAVTGHALLWSAEATLPLSNSETSARQAPEYESGGDCLRTPDDEDGIWALLDQLANHSEEDAVPELAPEILTRMREALALVVDDKDPAAFVIRRPGRIALSPAHLDVTFCLAAHPIEIRISGLDRDPGWIPAAGRHVDFHFE